MWILGLKGLREVTRGRLQLLVFSVMPFKIDQNKKNKNRSIDKVGIWEMRGGKYTKTLAKIQVRRIFRIRDI